MLQIFFQKNLHTTRFSLTVEPTPYVVETILKLLVNQLLLTLNESRRLKIDPHNDLVS